MAEGGLSNIDVNVWLGLFAPAGTPAPIVNRLNEAVNRVLKDTEVVGKITQAGVSMGGGSPAEFAAFVRTDYTRWGEIVRKSGVTLD
jgi:tripartite-type tricarboxylate transporter receptor subunit TctC